MGNQIDLNDECKRVLTNVLEDIVTTSTKKFGEELYTHTPLTLGEESLELLSSILLDLKFEAVPKGC